MTSASELFWRSRACRTPDPDLGLDPLSSSDRDPDLRHHRRRRGRRGRLHREDPDLAVGGLAHPGTPPSRHLCHRLSHAERESVRIDRTVSNESGTSNNSRSEAATSRANRLSITRNDRLPGAVLQARARLLERLRGISLTRNRQTIPSGISWDEFAASNDWETETFSEPYEPVFITDEDGSKKKPPGLSWEAFHNLRHEIFEDGDVSHVMGASVECAICLERFWEGDWLLRLSCGHRFHPPCLEPWVLTCGDCPYCRTII